MSLQTPSFLPARPTCHGVAGHAQFLVGTFVLTKGHASTAVVPAGLVGDGEHFGQPTAVTCNYKRLAERNQKQTVQTDRWAVWGGSQ